MSNKSFGLGSWPSLPLDSAVLSAFNSLVQNNKNVALDFHDCFPVWETHSADVDNLNKKPALERLPAFGGKENKMT